MTITHYRPHTQKKKQESYDYKLSPGGKFRILTLYLDLQKWKWPFTMVRDLALRYGVCHRRPAKIKLRFDVLRKQLYPRKPVDYKVNIFKERRKLTIHSWLNKRTKVWQKMKEFVCKYTRAWYATYKAHMKQHGCKSYIVPESTFKYRKPIMLQELWKPYKKKSYTNKKEVRQSKEFFDKLYGKYDFIINIDGKSLEDIPTI